MKDSDFKEICGVSALIPVEPHTGYTFWEAKMEAKLMGAMLRFSYNSYLNNW